MKVVFSKTIFVLTILIGTCYLMKPEKVDARWDFDRGTGNWVVDHGAGVAYCKGTWWNNECIGTQGFVNI